jgi:hypothetical protein
VGPTRHCAASGRLALGVLACLAAAGCWDFQKDVPDGPSALPVARYATVRVQYRQPNGCPNVTSPCDSRVVFFGSWMRPGEELLLDAGPGYVWTGDATNVPVNWPPEESPHLVRIFDPHLSETETGGVTAARLIVGGQIVTDYDQVGTPSESAYVYVDDVGVGHNPP